MKELYILDSSYNPTSAGCNRLLAFGLALKKQGIKVTIFYLFPYKNREKSERYVEQLNFVYLWEDSPFKNKYINTVRSLRKFYKLMKPSIPVYVYSLLNCLYFLRMKKGIKLYHEYTENPEVIGKLGGKLGDYLYNLYKRTIPRLDGLFLITPSLRDKYINEFGANPKSTILLNMVVDTSRFDKLKNIIPQKTISYCGIISERKDGVSLLIKSFAQVVSVYPDYSLNLIGPFIDSATESKLKELVRELQVESKVTFSGSISPDQMPLMLKSSQILALARPNNVQAKYGFATKIGEYLMTERPCVLTRVGAVEDYLRNRDSCILADVDNVDDFANQLIWTIKNYSNAEKIGKRGREVALIYFNSEREAMKIINLIFKKSNHEKN